MKNGLLVWIVVTVVNQLGIICDWVLHELGRPTITEWARQRPIIGITIIAVNILGLIGLAWHFWGKG